jgi:hypothetical protein
MGNANQWVKSAFAHGYPVINQPLPDTVAVFAGPGYSPEGHVAVVDSVNADGSYNVSEMNYSGWDQVDQRRVRPGQELGFIIPPGSMVANLGSTAASPAGYFAANANSGGCITRWNLPFGTSICMDGIVGGAAMAGGGVIMMGGVLVLVALAITSTQVGRASTSALGKGAMPVMRVVQHQQQQKAAVQRRASDQRAAAKTAAADTHQAAMRRSQLRISRARARTAESRARQVKVGQRPKVVENIDTRTPEGKARAKEVTAA